MSVLSAWIPSPEATLSNIGKKDTAEKDAVVKRNGDLAIVI
jgi:hypothetical protein